MRFTYSTLRDTVSVIRKQWGDRIQNFKDLDLLWDCEMCVVPVRIVGRIRGGEF
jgi:hypothetical protein